MIRYEKCPVCQSPNLNKILTAKDYTVSAEFFEVWQCAHCSLRLTQHVPGQEQIGKYYKSENYISHTESSKGLINWLYLRVRKITLAGKKRFIEKQTGLTRGRLLDVGAGTGAFLHYMRNNGWDVEGVEPDSKAIRKAADEYGIQLKPSDEIFSLPFGRYDVITLWHVLAHVHDLAGYMAQLKGLLKSGGKLIIAVPNYTSKDADYYGAFWAAYDVPRHLYHFSPASMQELTARYGLNIVTIQPMWFDSFYVSLLSEKYKTGRSNLIRGFINGLRSDSKALSNHRKASSVIYVLEDAQLPA